VTRAVWWSCVAAGAAAALAGLISDPLRAWTFLLVHASFALSVSLSALLFVAVGCLAAARWSVCLRRIAEALVASLPVLALVMAALVVLRGSVVPHGSVEAAMSPAKAAYLSVSFMSVRAAAILGVWVLLAALLRRESLRQDARGDRVDSGRLKKYSAIFVVAFALTFSVASFDWLMSLDPHWVSTIFPWYLASGLLALGTAAVALTAAALRLRGDALFVTDAHLHDLGRLLFAFSTVWAYLWFSQYLLIWYANIPEETTHYAVRTNHRWIALFWLNVVLNWILPFALLLSRAAKRDVRVVVAASLSIVAGRWLDLYLIVVPAMLAGPTLGFGDILVALAFLALIAGPSARALGVAPMLPINDPWLADSLKHQTS
jgi:hypothetical protein